MGIASHRGWSFLSAVRAWSGGQPGDVRAAACWAIASTGSAELALGGGRILITGAGINPHDPALAIAREMVNALPRDIAPDRDLAAVPETEEIADCAPGSLILIDTSQAATALSSTLRLPRSPGLAELCQYRARFEDVICRDARSPLHFLPSGRPRSVGGPWGEPGMADRIFRALDASYRYVLFCAEFDEALLLAETMKRPFNAAIVMAPGDGGDAPPASLLDRFGFPVLVTRA